MYISMKYVILYVSGGTITGLLSNNDRTVCIVGLGISALLGASFGLAYALISAIEFALGLAIASLILKKSQSNQDLE